MKYIMIFYYYKLDRDQCKYLLTVTVGEEEDLHSLKRVRRGRPEGEPEEINCGNKYFVFYTEHDIS